MGVSNSLKPRTHTYVCSFFPVLGNMLVVFIITVFIHKTYSATVEKAVNGMK